MANAQGLINNEVAIGIPVDDQQQQQQLPDTNDNQTMNYDPAQNFDQETP